MSTRKYLCARESIGLCAHEKVSGAHEKGSVRTRKYLVSTRKYLVDTRKYRTHITGSVHACVRERVRVRACVCVCDFVLIKIVQHYAV